MKSTFMQIGVTAARDPKTGEFLESVPIFKEISSSEQYEPDFIDAGKMFAEKMKQYMESQRRS